MKPSANEFGVPKSGIKAAPAFAEPVTSAVPSLKPERTVVTVTVALSPTPRPETVTNPDPFIETTPAVTDTSQEKRGSKGVI